jgi:cytoskeleton protein RodZ
MSELGQWLREARQAKGFSLVEAEVGTRIRSKFLNALEEGNYDELPAEVYTKGFLRNYALFLGLDPTEALERYRQRETDRRGGEPGLFRPLEVTLFHATFGRLRVRLLLLLLIVSTITVGLWAWRTGRLRWLPPLALFQSTATPLPGHAPTATSELPTAVVVRETPTPESTPTAEVGGAPAHTLTPTASPVTSPTETLVATPSPTSRVESPTPTGTPEQPSVQPTAALTTEVLTPTATLEPGTGVTVSILVSEECWTEVTLDSLSEFRGLLTAGEGRAWQARREIILRLGNAGGVEVTVNGEALGTLGERQQVVEFAWGPEGEVTPQPTATPQVTVEALETFPR